MIIGPGRAPEALMAECHAQEKKLAELRNEQPTYPIPATPKSVDLQKEETVAMPLPPVRETSPTIATSPTDSLIPLEALPDADLLKLASLNGLVVEHSDRTSLLTLLTTNNIKGMDRSPLVRLNLAKA